MSRDDEHFRLRLPRDLKALLKAEAERNVRSLTAQIVFALKKEMAARAEPASTTPAADNDEAALQGGSL